MSLEPAAAAPPKQETAEPIPIKYCGSCGRTLGRVRNKKYCSGACRLAAHRVRNGQNVSK